MLSMTGFGSKEGITAFLGRVCIELRSTNHKFQEIVFHLPEGLLSLEDRIKKVISAKIKRGRVTCVVSVVGAKSARAFINKDLLRQYIVMLKNIKKKFQINDEISINTIMHLPGVLALEEPKGSAGRIWPTLKILFEGALEELLKARRKEGRAIYIYLRGRQEALKLHLRVIRTRFKRVLKEKLKHIANDEERAAFLKDVDITEEIERLTFHIKNFRNKLSKAAPIGKELDFIAQEMQREANTLGAKSIDVKISARAIQIKSQIEKIREQVQNLE